MLKLVCTNNIKRKASKRVVKAVATSTRPVTYTETCAGINPLAVGIKGDRRYE